ncbi:MAG TPA: DUF262 domain-containing protein [Puia sp.]|nr:DUF262 domain-containing protein [Puia sp.]
MSENKVTALENQILERGKEVHTESYSMSIGEIKNLYEEGDLDLYPEFQRFFRWEDDKKYRLIESILLGIPLPSFFVYQRQDGVWDVVDGLQRLSTIFEFMGVLKNEDRETLPPLTMQATKYLPSLANLSWHNPDHQELEISETIKRDFKRKKLDFNIILKTSDESAKYELFDRLNTGGSTATSQEVRNGILLRENKEVFMLIDRLSENENFVNTIVLSDSNIEERFDLELISRFIILRNLDLSLLSGTTASEYLTEELIKRAQADKYDWSGEIQAFEKTFDMINSQLQSDAFKKYNLKKTKFEGGFVASAFEVIALGIGFNPQKVDPSSVREKAISFWAAKEQGSIKWAGRNTTSRLQITIEFGRNLFQE